LDLQDRVLTGMERAMAFVEQGDLLAFPLSSVSEMSPFKELRKVCRAPLYPLLWADRRSRAVLIFVKKLQNPSACL